jgi:hypothetical protein
MRKVLLVAIVAAGCLGGCGDHIVQAPDTILCQSGTAETSYFRAAFVRLPERYAAADQWSVTVSIFGSAEFVQDAMAVAKCGDSGFVAYSALPNQQFYWTASGRTRVGQ